MDTGKFSFSLVRPWEERYKSPINFIMPVLDDKLLFIATSNDDDNYWNLENYIDVISLWEGELISTLE